MGRHSTSWTSAVSSIRRVSKTAPQSLLSNSKIQRALLDQKSSLNSLGSKAQPGTRLLTDHFPAWCECPSISLQKHWRGYFQVLGRVLRVPCPLWNTHHVLSWKSEKSWIPKHVNSPKGFRSGLVGPECRMSGVQRGPAIGDSSKLANHFRLVHRKECSRKPSMCGPEAGREKWIDPFTFLFNNIRQLSKSVYFQSLIQKILDIALCCPVIPWLLKVFPAQRLFDPVIGSFDPVIGNSSTA